MKKVLIGLIVAAATTALMVRTALAGGNSDAAHACQQSGWQNLVRQDGTGFTNTGDCVSYGAQGGVLKTKSSNAVSTGGSENFSGDASGSPPTAFAGGTSDPASYAPGASTPDGGTGGSILVSGPYFNGFTQGTHFLFTGWGVNPAKLTFTIAVKSVQLQAENNHTGITAKLTLTGYDASGNVVATDTETDVATGAESVTMNITSQSIQDRDRRPSPLWARFLQHRLVLTLT